MCGRFTIEYSWAEVHDAMNLIPTSAKGRNDPPRYNVAPTQDVGFICKDHHDEDDNEIVVKDGRWWLVPFWAKEIPKYPMFNARSETAHEKSSFREPFKSRRCLIPATAYYEWTVAEDKKKDPHIISLPEKEPFFFAGLWAHNSNLEITSCTILTSEADPAIAHLHHRMPIILKEEAWMDWLSKETEVEDARTLLTQNRGDELVSYRVDRAVNSSKSKGPDLIKPISV